MPEPITLRLGDTILLPTRVAEATDLRMRVEAGRAHNLPHMTELPFLGVPLKILAVAVRQPRGTDPIVEATIADDHEGVNLTALSRGLAQVDVIDELSSPLGTLGASGGIDVLVLDEHDLALQPAPSPQPPKASHPTPPPADEGAI